MLCGALVAYGGLATWFAGGAGAGTISLDIRTDVMRKGDRIEIMLRVRNAGDETARGVHPAARLEGTVFDFQPQDVPAGDMVELRATAAVSGLNLWKPGTYPIPIVVSYTDSEGTVRNAPSYGILRTANISVPAPSLQVNMPPRVTLMRTSEVSVGLLNTAERSFALTATLHSLAGVEISPRSCKIELGPEAVTNLLFSLANRAERPPVDAPLLLFVEVEDDQARGVGVFETVISVMNGSEIPPPSPVTDNTGFRWAVIASILLIVAAGIATLVCLARRSQ